MRLALGLSRQVEEVGVRSGIRGEDSRRWCCGVLGLDLLFVLKPVFDVLVGAVNEKQ